MSFHGYLTSGGRPSRPGVPVPLNRLNVATSRARCAAILVASPHPFEPDCRTPRQMRLANALCSYLEMATAVEILTPGVEAG